MSKSNAEQRLEEMKGTNRLEKLKLIAKHGNFLHLAYECSVPENIVVDGMDFIVGESPEIEDNASLEQKVKYFTKTDFINRRTVEPIGSEELILAGMIMNMVKD